MPGLLDFAVQQGQAAEGLQNEAARSQGDVFMRRMAEKEATQQGLGQLAGTGLGYAVGKRKTQRAPAQDTTSLSQILGNIGQTLMSHWMPQHGTYTAYNQAGPDTGIETTPQEGPQ